MRDYIEFYLNGKHQSVKGDDVFLSLSDYLRQRAHLKGTKVVCSEGDCGACTVMVCKLDGEGKYKSINSCIALVALLDNHHIVTIEGLKVNGEPHEIQKAMVENNGAQCGFCSPGFVMSIADMYENKEEITEKLCRNYLTGNLCRCTGYGPIIDAALSVDPKKSKKIKDLYSALNSESSDKAITVKTNDKEFYAPIDLKSAIELKAANPKMRIISSATDIGVQINKDIYEVDKLISLDKIKDFHDVKVTDSEVEIGARVSLEDVEKTYLDIDNEFARFLHLFASPQIKNFGTLVGNMANGSPIGDTLPYLAVMEAQVEVIGKNGVRRISFNDFYKGYKQLDLTSDEIITKVIVPRRSEDESLRLYKVSNRKDLDISCVNAAISLKMSGETIDDIKIAYGGVGPTVLRLPKLEKEMIGKKFDADSFRNGSHLIKNEITPMSDVRGTSEYRHLVAKNLFQRFYLDIKKELS